MEEDKIKKAYSAIYGIVGDNVSKYCNAIVSFLDEYKKAKGLSGNEIFDIDDFLRWLEANKYDWMVD